MSVEVRGVGLVSPMALTAAEHVFYVRAGAPLCGLGDFVDGQGEPFDVALCPWLEPTMPRDDRIVRLGAAAATEALVGGIRSRRVPAIVVSGGPPAGAPPPASVAEAWQRELPITVGAHCHGAAGIFRALRVAESWLASVDEVLIIAADSGIDLQRMPLDAAAPSEWERTPPPLAEGAAAVLVGRQRGGWGRVLISLDATSKARDDDDSTVDGEAMTALLRSAMARNPSALPIVESYGPHNLDELRQLTWNYAAARCFDEGIAAECALLCVEDDIGRLGAAGGSAHLAYGLARARHLGAASTTMAVWSVAADGTVGLALVEADNE